MLQLEWMDDGCSSSSAGRERAGGCDTADGVRSIVSPHVTAAALVVADSATGCTPATNCLWDYSCGGGRLCSDCYSRAKMAGGSSHSCPSGADGLAPAAGCVNVTATAAFVTAAAVARSRGSGCPLVQDVLSGSRRAAAEPEQARSLTLLRLQTAAERWRHRWG